MKQLSETVGLLPTEMRLKSQINHLSTIYVSGGVGSEILNFEQKDVLTLDDDAPLIMYPITVIGSSDIEITITYNSGSSYDIIMPSDTDQFVLVPTTISSYKITDISYKIGTSDKGTPLDRIEFYNLTGNNARLLYIHAFSMSDVQEIVYEMLRALVMTEARDDWLDKLALSWELVRIPGESDQSLRERIIIRSTPTDGTIASVIVRVRSYLELTISDSVTVTESYDQDGWILDQSRLLAGGQSELVLTGDISIEAMQFIMSITGYVGSLTEEDIENFLRGIINVGASPIVRLI